MKKNEEKNSDATTKFRKWTYFFIDYKQEHSIKNTQFLSYVMTLLAIHVESSTRDVSRE